MRLLLIFSSCFLYVCCTEPRPLNELHKLTLTEIVDWQRQDKLDVDKATFVNAYDEAIGTQENQLLEVGAAGFDFYVADDQLQKVLVRQRTYQDDIITVLRSHAGYHPSQEFEMTNQYCDSIPQTVAQVIERDQGVRSGSYGGSMQDVDFENQVIMVSIFEKCDSAFAKLSNAQVRDLWFVAQHADAELMAYYYPWFHDAVEQGRMNTSTFALMIDRLLMYHNYPQVYGSQVSNDALYPVRDQERVDERRAAIGLGPLAEYLEYFGL